MLKKLGKNNGKINEFLLIIDRNYDSVIIPKEEFGNWNDIRIYGPFVENGYVIYLCETNELPNLLKVYDISEEYPDVKETALGAYISSREFTQHIF